MRNTETLSAGNGGEGKFQEPIDWADVKFTLVLGILMAGVKLELNAPMLEMRRTTTDEVASMLVVGYILLRASRNHEKLKAWGLTVPLTSAAILTGLAMLVVALGMLAIGGVVVAGTLSFTPAYVTQMVEYIPAAFPQQFVMCSVGLATLATLRPFHGLWRLPLAVGLIFSLLLDTARIPEPSSPFKWS